jgi:hypothetical protein
MGGLLGYRLTVHNNFIVGSHKLHAFIHVIRLVGCSIFEFQDFQNPVMRIVYEKQKKKSTKNWKRLKKKNLRQFFL